MTFKKLLYPLLAVLGLALGACSDKGGDEPGGGDYEVDEYATSMLRQVWKIAEHEYAGKSYYTKDFETSWLINAPFAVNGRTYAPLSYKLSLQTEVQYVSDVEVRDYLEEPELVICESNTGKRIFTIEEYYNGGNYWVMIIRDRQGNRFRCESRSDATVFFANNRSSCENLSLEYKNLIASDASYKTIDYTVKALPRNVVGAYAILLEGDAYAVSYEVTTPGGASKFQTSSELTTGFNQAEITDEGFDGGGDDPDPSPAGDYDTVAEDILNGVFVSDNGYGDKFLINAEMSGIGRPLSACVDGKYVYHTDRIRVRNMEDGTKWVVMSPQEVTRLYRLIDYAADGSSITISPREEPNSIIVLSRQDDCLVHFYKNETASYGLRVQLKQVAQGDVDYDTKHWRNQAVYGGDGIGAIPIRWYDKSKPLTITSTIEVYDVTDANYGVEFEYTSTVEPGSSMFARTVITDADIPHEPTKEEIAALEAKLWQDGAVTAWRVDKCVSLDGDYYKECGGYLIFERELAYKQGLHFYNDITHSNYHDNNYLCYEDGILKFKNWDSDRVIYPEFEIFTPLDKIMQDGEMIFRYNNHYCFHVVNCKQPLVVYCIAGSGVDEYSDVRSYTIKQYNAYGRLISERKIEFKDDIRVRKTSKGGAFVLAADETSDVGNGYFTVEVNYVSKNKAYYKTSRTNLGLNNIVTIELTH